MQLRTVDLNLLVVLRALLDDGSIKDAAKTLALSPSATSHALGRLRELFDDPLFVRAGQRMVPTPRATALEPEVRRWLEGAELLLAPRQHFDPAKLHRSFTFGSTDFGELVLLPSWSAHLARVAPRVDLLSRPLGDNGVAGLRSGQLDLAIGVFFRNRLPDDIRLRPLLKTRFVTLLRRGHPALRQRLTVKRFSELRHVLVSPRGVGLGVVDQELADRGLERRVARTVANFSAAPLLVATSDDVVTIAEPIARRFAQLYGLKVLAPPLPLEGFTVSAAWHRRFDVDTEHDWLRSTLQEAAEELPT